jgi:dipeptidyl aminopeptidase/acylaminoacyl peptidase
MLFWPAMNVRRVGLAVGTLATASLALAARPAAQAPRPLTLVSLAEIPRVQDVQLSPDGRFVSYMLARADWKANRQVTHIWRQAVAGGASVALTTGDAADLLARWSPDSRTVLYLSGGQIWLVPAEGGPARQLTHHATSVYGGAPPVWSPDGASIYFLASDPPTDAERERDRVRDDVFVFEGNYKQRHLWNVGVATGAEHKLTDGAYSVLSFRVSRDGTRIAQHRAPTPLLGDVNRGEIWIADAAGTNARAVTANGIEEDEAELSPDNSRLLFIAEANARLEPYYSSSLFTVPAAGGPPSMVLPNFPYAIEHASWSPDGTHVLAVVNMGVHSEVFRIDVGAHTARALTDGRHSVQFWSLAPAAARMVFQFDEPTRLGDAWTLPLDGGTPTRVTGVYDSLAQYYVLPRQDKVSWKGSDGATVEGLLFYPLGYEAGKRYPLVVQLHGGPQESDKFGYGPGVIVNYVPVLAAKGYAVLRPNYRGSAGYGNAFLRDVVGVYFRNMHLDVMAGVDALVDDGLADPDRLAVMGWSAGGHLTNKLITFTTRFKAASSAAGASNWTSFFAETDTRANRSAWFQGLPWGHDAPVDAFWNNSPLKDAAKVRTPTLLIAGEADARVPFPQAVEMFRALTANGVPTRLYVAPREPHQWQELRHQLFKANAELEWFERHVMGRSYVWEGAPGDAR